MKEHLHGVSQYNGLYVAQVAYSIIIDAMVGVRCYDLLGAKGLQQSVRESASPNRRLWDLHRLQAGCLAVLPS